ncbi:MAG: polyprenyl synthetase family protein [Bacteroidales bacterium]|nr:polyprenyl synthetase family protein [Bacteroidales bacterium]MDY0347534.1 polyprenyl synthetase family protein [Tenuifilaceae bacterium]
MLSDIKKPVSKEVKEFEPYFNEVMSSKVPLLSTITNYIYRRKGKQIRPVLVFLSAGLNGDINKSTFVAAGMIELLHTATLIHDDVVDEAYERRGSFSIKALWRSKIAVLVGDYLLSKGMLLAVETGEFELLRNMSNAVKEMSEGELMQIDRSRKMNIDVEAYFDIIHKKTAALIASCLVNGAVSAGASPTSIEKMNEYGVNLGLAFQIKDDIFDYQTKGAIGKPFGNDIKENKLTLPLIYALAQADAATKKRVLSLLRKSKRDNGVVRQVIEFTEQQGGIAYAQEKMLYFVDKAKEAIVSYPDSDYKNSLIHMADFVANRTK